MGPADAAAEEAPEPERPEPPVPLRAPEDVNWDALFPPSNQYRAAIVQHVLPHLLTILQDANARLRAPRDLVNAALDKCRHTNLWGTYGTYTRRWTVADAVLMHYFPVLQKFVANQNQHA